MSSMREKQLSTLQLYLYTTLVSGVLSGFACLSNPCLNGVCMDDLSSSYFCYCINGYTGIQCQTNWNECWSSPCQNGGVCIDGIAMFNCSCTPGYTGKLCEEDIDECDSNPCLNNGTCLDAKNGYICQCLSGYIGVHCEIDVAVCNITNTTRCSNGGSCIEGPGESFSCQCPPGWGGVFCDVEIDECLSAPCQNGAVCLDLHDGYSCACLFGFTGHDCEEAIQICDDNPCRNGALCLVEDAQFVCYCVPDFYGDLCQFQYNECQLGPRCMNGGTCIDGIDNFTCSCPSQLTGVLCECLILTNNDLDCTYIRPESTEVTTWSTSPTILTTVLASATSSLDTTESPTMEVTIKMTEPPGITETSLMTITTYEPVFSQTSSNVLSSVSTFTPSIDNYTSSQTPTDYYSTITLPFVSTSGLGTSQLPSVTTELFAQTIDYVKTTGLWSPTSKLTTEEIDYSMETISPVSVTQSSTFFETSPSISTGRVPFTRMPTSTELSSTTMEAATTYSTTARDIETNRSLTEEETTFRSSISTYLTTEPIVDTKIYTMPTDIDSTSALSTIESKVTDCTDQDTPCQNGGSCIFTGQGHKCLCPSETEGDLCQIRLEIKNVAFDGRSYIAHRLLNLTHVAVEFEAKTMADGGLLFYANVDTTYMELYVEDGNLKFKFSCGYQTMLLSELDIYINNGYTINIKAWLDFSPNFTHCYAGVKVNDTLTMAGDQIARMNVFYKPFANLYIGGIPEELKAETTIGGLIGCLSNLKISNTSVNIYKDAGEVQGTTECTSLPCLSNPCHNGATCTSLGDIWQCDCKNGYTGKTCSMSVCDHNPCLFGGTCLPFTNNGYICLCPFGKHGHFCENDLKISEPYFSSTVGGLSSFVAYPFPDGITKNMELKFRFSPTTMEQISLLLFLGQTGHHDFYSDHLAVSFVKGYIMLTWNLGSGPRRIFTTQPLKKGAANYLVKLGHVGRKAWLYVENIGNITGRSPGNFVKLDVVPVLFIGGHDSKSFSTLPHDLPLHTGFSGCIFDIEMKSGSVAISFQSSLKTVGRAVGQCGTAECYEQSCQNGGACLHHGSTFMCMCQDNWYGPLCTSKHNYCNSNLTKCAEGSTCIPQMSKYECDCPIGRTGEFCQKTESITDVSLTGKRSYISLQPIEIETSRFHIEMEIRILQDNGVIFFVKREGKSFLSLSLTDGLLELRIQSASKRIHGEPPLSIRSSKLLVKAVWHKIKFGIFGKRVYLSVDNIINTGTLDNSHNILFSDEIIYLGGLPDMSQFPNNAASSLPIPFNGCLRHVSINDKSIPLTTANIKESRNMVDCDGTPCGSELCHHGGTCWLDSFLKPHCSCIPPYYGENCEKIQNCEDNKSCKSYGICQNNTCICNVGRSGAFCEKEIIVKKPKFAGDSYLIVNKIGDKRRALRNVRSVYLNFTTVYPNGLLLWNKNKGRSFLGVGLEYGFLKLAYSVANTTAIQIYSHDVLSDGLWHFVDIKLNPFSIKIDGKLMESEQSMNNLLRNITTSDVFYVGGIPRNNSLLEESDGMFSHGFKGCIDGFGQGDEYLRDFSRNEGNHVDICELF